MGVAAWWGGLRVCSEQGVHVVLVGSAFSLVGVVHGVHAGVPLFRCVLGTPDITSAWGRVVPMIDLCWDGALGVPGCLGIFLWGQGTVGTVAVGS